MEDKFALIKGMACHTVLSVYENEGHGIDGNLALTSPTGDSIVPFSIASMSASDTFVNDLRQLQLIVYAEDFINVPNITVRYENDKQSWDAG